MNNKNFSAVVYPYDMQFAPLLRHKELLDNIEIVGVVSPFCTGLCGKDAGTADKGTSLGIIVEEDFTEAIMKGDSVLFVQTEMDFDFNSNIYPKIEEAVKLKKNIILSISVSKEKYDAIEVLCNENGVVFEYRHTKKWDKVELKPATLKAHVLHTFDVPIIFVLGDGERTNKFETQLAIRDFFIKEGYKVSQIGSRGYCELLGFHSIPNFMYEARNEMEKIFLYNKFVKKIELDERPDVIIVGVPGAIMSLNNNNPAYCGIMAYEISNAVSPDATVFCMYCTKWEKEYYDEFMDVMKHKFGYDVQAYVMSNTKLNWMSMAEGKNKQDFFYLGDEKLEQQKVELKEDGVTVYNIHNKSDADEMCNVVLNRLTGFAEIESF